LRLREFIIEKIAVVKFGVNALRLTQRSRRNINEKNLKITRCMAKFSVSPPGILCSSVS